MPDDPSPDVRRPCPTVGRGLEATYLERLAWILRLHATAGASLWAAAILQYLVAPMPHGLVLLTILFLIVGTGVAGTWWLVAWWRRTRAVPIEVFYRGTMNGLALFDGLVLTLGLHFGGGADTPGLSFCLVPLVVYGSFLPRRDVYAHAVWIATIVGIVVYGQCFGWLPRTCPPLDGYVCAAASPAFVTSRYVSFVALAWVATYLTVYVGTNLQRQEAEARQVAQAWEQVATMRSRFVSHASHEFRTPLAVIASTAAVLRRYGDRLSAGARETKLAKIESTVAYMTEILDRVLRLGRAESDAFELRREVVAVAGLAARATEDARAEATVAHSLVCLTEDAVPSIETDPMLLRQVLDNLLSNAIKYSPEGGDVVVRVAARPAGIAIEVSDQGLGIPPEQQEHVFDAFHRASNVGKLSGTGLGLAITRRAVELLGGTIALTSRVRAGTTVTVVLPVSGTGDDRRAA